MKIRHGFKKNDGSIRNVNILNGCVLWKHEGKDLFVSGITTFLF